MASVAPKAAGSAKPSARSAEAANAASVAKSEALLVVEALRRFAEEIAAMRSEIAQLKSSELATERLPAAGRQLGQITETTEAAANAIMEAVEAMLAADAADADAYKSFVSQKAMAIFEACAFQDVTGQLIKRVGETVSQIEARIVRIADAIETSALVIRPEDMSDRQKRERALLLNGPQSRSEAIAQTDIDALLAGL